ncbi:MAG: hypothetical protein H7840_15730 [Alphaproteobacteria bacterium]
MALQVGNFLVLVWLLQRFLYRPVAALIERRRAATDQAFAEAEAARAAAEREGETLRAARAALAGEREALLTEAAAEGLRQRESILDQARRDAEAYLTRARTSLAEARDAVVATLKREAEALAVDMAAAILRQASSPAVAEAALETLSGRLVPLTGPATVAVVTAPALDEAARDRWSRRLTALLGPEAVIAFTTDPALIAGARILLPTRHFSLHWAEALAGARGEAG